MQIVKRFVDYSFSQPPPQVIKVAGYAGVAIYTDDALPNAAYIQQLRDVGLEVLFIKEGGATEAYGGFDVGVRFAQSANDRVDSVGAPPDCAIAYVLADAAFTDPSVQPALKAFGQGVRSVGRRGYKVGYGNEAALRYGGSDFWWGVETWSDSRNGLAGWDGKTPPVAMIQMANTRALDIPGYDTDENIVLIENFGQWGASSAPQAQPPLPVSHLSMEGQNTMLIFTDQNGTACEFYISSGKLYVRYYLQPEARTFCISEPPWANAGPNSAPIVLDPNTGLIPISVYGLTLVHAATADGHLIEAFPGPYGYQTRVVG